MLLCGRAHDWTELLSELALAISFVRICVRLVVNLDVVDARRLELCKVRRVEWRRLVQSGQVDVGLFVRPKQVVELGSVVFDEGEALAQLASRVDAVPVALQSHPAADGRDLREACLDGADDGGEWVMGRVINRVGRLGSDAASNEARVLSSGVVAEGYLVAVIAAGARCLLLGQCVLLQRDVHPSCLGAEAVQDASGHILPSVVQQDRLEFVEDLGVSERLEAFENL